MSALTAHDHALTISRPILRPYQEKCVESLRASYAAGHRAPLLQLATGGGKTLIFTEVTRGARAKGHRVLIVVHRRELLKQAIAKLTWAGVQHGIIAAGFKSSARRTGAGGPCADARLSLRRVARVRIVCF